MAYVRMAVKKKLRSLYTEMMMVLNIFGVDIVRRIMMGRVYERQTPQGHIKYPSVTTIIGEGTNNHGLIYWAVNCVIEYIKNHLVDIAKGLISWKDIDLDKAKKYHEEVSKEARDIGSIVHRMIEDRVHSKMIWLTLENRSSKKEPTYNHSFIMSFDIWRESFEVWMGFEVSDEIARAVYNALNAFEKWMKKVDFKPLASEMIVYNHRHRYAGTLDCLAYINGKLYVIDFKTSKAHYNTASFQISAYCKAVIEMIKLGNLNFPIPQGIGVLRLDKETGLPDWKDYSKNYRNHWQWFKLEVQQYYLAKKRRSGTLTVF